VRYLDWSQREVEFLNKYLLLTSKPMIYLINLNKKDYMEGKFPNRESVEAAITYDGKHPANIIPYSVEFEQLPPEERGSTPSLVDKIIRVGYE
jgi:obg-like ATPase 1